MIGWYHQLKGHKFEQTPGDRPNIGIKPMSLMFPAPAGGFFATSTTWEAQFFYGHYIQILQDLSPVDFLDLDLMTLNVFS